MSLRATVLAVLLSLSGCGVVAGTIIDTVEDGVTYPIKNGLFLGAWRHDNAWDEGWKQLESKHDDGEELVGVCLSGGGSRAAYFATCVLDELGRERMPGRARTWLEEVDWISSVSGGSLAASYFAANRRREGYPAEHHEFFARMREDMRMDFELRGIARVLLGWGFPLFLTHYDRGDLMARVWDSNFMDGLTFGDLPDDGPALILNAISYDTGQRFLFTRLSLADLNGARLFEALKRRRLTTQGYGRRHVPFVSATLESLDSSIERCPLTTGIVASAAVPNLLGPVSLQDRKFSTGEWHLGDGGIYDNHGLETMVGVVAQRLEHEPARRATIIIIDGSGFFETEAEGVGDVSTVAGFSDRTVSIALLRAASFAEATFVTGGLDEAVDRIDFVVLSLYADASLRPDAHDHADSALGALKDLAEESAAGLITDLNERLRAVGTRFSITDENADAIEEATPGIVLRALRRHQHHAVGPVRGPGGAGQVDSGAGAGAVRTRSAVQREPGSAPPPEPADPSVPRGTIGSGAPRGPVAPPPSEAPGDDRAGGSR